MDTMNIQEKVGFGGVFNLKVYANQLAQIRGDVPLHEITVHNKMTNKSLAAITGLVGNTGSIVAFTYLAVGTSSTAVSASHTALQAELSTLGLSRSIATVARTTTTQTNDTLSLTFTWSVTGTTTVEEIGIFNASGGGDGITTNIMLARALTGSIAVVNTNQLVATYTWQAIGN